MNIVSFVTSTGDNGLGIETDDELIDVTPFLPDGDLSPLRRLLETGQASEILDRAATEGKRIARSDVVIGPVVPDPTKIVAAPVNYRNHQEEMSQDAQVNALGVFLKAPSSVIGDGGTVRLPYVDRRFDQEGELAVVIGTAARNVSREEARDHVFGYTCLLDMTMRGGEDRSTRKSFDTFTPVGPRIVTPDSMPPLEDLEIRTLVNGTLRQRADVTDLIWDIPQLIAYASSVMTLHPGDIITSGTPEGVGQIFEGDEVSVEVTGIGPLTVTVSAQGAVVCPTLGADRGPKPPTELTPVSERAAR